MLAVIIKGVRLCTASFTRIYRLCVRPKISGGDSVVFSGVKEFKKRNCLSVRESFAIRNVSETSEWRYRQRSNGLAHVSVASSEFADGRRNEVASPDSEQIELAGAVPHRRNSVSLEQIQDRLRRTAFFVFFYFISTLLGLRSLISCFGIVIVNTPS